MSAEVTVRAAVVAGLKADAELAALLNGVFDGQPGRAALPYAVVGECIASDWGGKGLDGRELRLALSLHDAGDGAGRIGAMLARVDPVMHGLDVVEGGWRVVGARLIRSRLLRSGARDGDGWRAVVDYRVRVVAEVG